MPSKQHPLQEVVDRHKEDISALQYNVHDLNMTISHLSKNTKIVSDLLKTKTKHNLEIVYIKKGIQDLLQQSKETNSRIARIEAFYMQHETERKVKNKLLFGIKNYWHLIAMASGIIAYLLGIHTNG